MISQILVCALLISSAFYAGAAEAPPDQEPNTLEKAKEAVVEKVEETSSKVEKSVENSRSFRGRADYFALASYSPLDLLIPSKIGVTAGVVNHVDKTWELEYLRGSISVPFIVEDLGKMTDERISIIGRAYSETNSFNFSYGLSYYDFSLRLGSDILNRLGGGGYPSVDVIQIQSLGLNFGLGNRWSISRNTILGVDWFSWSQPLYTLKKDTAFLDRATDANDRDNVDTLVKIVSSFPRFSLLKVQLGVYF